MMSRHHLAPYGHSYGYVAGTKEITSQVAQTAITGVSAALFSAIDGYSLGDYPKLDKDGKEIKGADGKPVLERKTVEVSVGPIPLTLLAGAALHAAAFVGSDEAGEVYGIDADYIHSAGAGAIAAWAATRGFEIGKKMKEKALAEEDKKKKPAPGTPAPAKVEGYARVGQGGYAGYRPQDVYASQFMR